MKSLYLTPFKACCDCSIVANWMMALVLIFVYNSGKWKRKVAAKRLHFLSLETWASFPYHKTLRIATVWGCRLRNVLFLLYFVFRSAAFFSSSADISDWRQWGRRQRTIVGHSSNSSHFNTPHLSYSLLVLLVFSLITLAFFCLWSSQTFFAGKRQLLRWQTATELCFICHYQLKCLSYRVNYTHGSPNCYSILFTVFVCTQAHEELKCDCPFSLLSILGTKQVNLLQGKQEATWQ